MKIEIDELKCVGAGQCVMAAEEVFDQRDDDGMVILLDAEPPEGEHGRARTAAALCPAAAILVHE